MGFGDAPHRVRPEGAVDPISPVGETALCACSETYVVNRTSDVFRTDELESWGAYYWVGVLCSVGIVAINFGVGIRTGQPQFLLIGGSFLLGVGLFFTRYWSPVLYLLGVLHVGVLGVMWLLAGMPFLLLGLLNGALSLGLATIALVLFFKEGSHGAT